MAGLSQWPHTTSWGSHDEAANVHSLLKSSAPAPNYFSGLIGSKVPVEFRKVARSLCWCAVFSGLHVSIWILLRTTQVFIEPTVLCIFKNIKYLMPLFIHPNFALVGNRETIRGTTFTHNLTPWQTDLTCSFTVKIQIKSQNNYSESVDIIILATIFTIKKTVMS